MAEAKEIKSTCGMCFAACGVLIQVEDGKVVKVKGDPQSPVNHGVLCPKGRAAPLTALSPGPSKTPAEADWRKRRWAMGYNILG